MDDERAMRARNAGRATVTANTAWTLQAGPLQCRCVKIEKGFQLQVRDTKGWRDMFDVGDDPVRMLRVLTNSDIVVKALSTTPV